MMTLDTIRRVESTLDEIQIDVAQIMSSNDESVRQRRYIDVNRKMFEMYTIINQARLRLGKDHERDIDTTANELTD